MSGKSLGQACVREARRSLVPRTDAQIIRRSSPNARPHESRPINKSRSTSNDLRWGNKERVSRLNERESLRGDSGNPASRSAGGCQARNSK